LNDVLILPHSANQSGWHFRERKVRGLGDDPSHDLSPRSRGTLLGFGDALKIF
jgi:hypothetical protein